MSLKENKDTPEYIKSGYLYNLANFFEWPLNVFNFSVSPFMLGLYGDHSMDRALFDTMRDKRIKDRDWKVDYYQDPTHIRHCHLLFISGTSDEEVSRIIQQLKGRKILTVGNCIDNFCQLGGVVNLQGSHPNYGYEINQEALKKAGLKVDPAFLELATIIG